MLLSQPAKAEDCICKLTRVIDGDTAVVSCRKLHGKRYKEMKVRLSYIDAPEIKQDYGLESKSRLEAFLEPETMLTLKSKDKYGRSLGVFYYPNTEYASINEVLVVTGSAWAYPKSPKLYSELQERAKLNSLGLWAQPNPMPPWEYRKLPKQPAAKMFISPEEATIENQKINQENFNRWSRYIDDQLILHVCNPTELTIMDCIPEETVRELKNRYEKKGWLVTYKREQAFNTWDCIYNLKFYR